ncbi:MAG TPA: enoyl-CoA hydratase-related protein [Ramlibacter sp.]|jgi:enoyl-CoA hydratase/carnithine racemase
MTGSIRVTREGAVATVTLDNVTKRNALTQQMFITLGTTMDELGRDPELRCIVLTGAGEEAFGSGGDIEEYARLRASKEQSIAFSRDGLRTMHAVRDCPVPTVAAIRGACVGGAFQIAGFCDLRICAEGSRFGIPLTKLGSTLSYTEFEGMVRFVGRKTAMEILLEGRLFDAQEAYVKGIVNRVVPRESFEAEVRKTVERIATGAPLVARWHKKFSRRLEDPAPLSAAEHEEAYECYDTDDYRIGYEAFLNKRKPEFVGR